MRGMNRWVAVGGGLLALACVLFVYGRLSGSVVDDAEQVAPAADATELALAPSDEPKPAPQALHELEGEPAPSVAARTSPSPTAVARPPMPSSGNFELMQRAFESQTRDAAWASEQEARIPQLLTEAGFQDDAFDRNVTCRSTLCRFSLVVAEDDEADLFALMKLSDKVQTSQGVALSYGAAEAAGEKSRIVVFMLREGTSDEDLQAR
jgi:hypothetical protein